jgi:membrane protein YdbS with pleckstrin-like domain
MRKVTMFVTMLWCIVIVGCYYIAEGIANLIYWSGSHQPWLFTYGRVFRVVLGIYLIIIAVVLWVEKSWSEPANTDTP